MGKKRRRSVGKIDRLQPTLKETVEQMLLTGSTYREIVEYLHTNGEEVSQMSVCRYAEKYLAAVEMVHVAQENFSMLIEEVEKYPDLDTSEALIRLSSQHVLNALANVTEDQLEGVPIDKLIQQTNGLIRAAAYKKRIAVQNQDALENGMDQVKSMVWETMAKERPDLYKQVSAYIDSKKDGDS